MATSMQPMAIERQQILPKPALTINHLAEILDILKRVGYSGTSYFNLGLFLGLFSHTLDVIKENNKADVSSGLRECLKAWLEQADNVKSVGVPSYYSLIQALRKLEENTVADGIDGRMHPACVIFTTQCESNKVIVTALPYLPIHKEIIGHTTSTEVEVLLKALKEAVCADYHNLERFGIILSAELNDKSIGQVLLDEYRRKFPVGCASITSGDQVKISFPLELCEEFTKIRARFTDLKLDVAKAMKKKVKIKKLKEYFSTSRAHLKSRIASCKKITDLVLLVGDNCSLINVALLENAVERFKVEEAKPALEKYREEIDKFYSGRPLRDFLEKRLSFDFPLLQYKAVTISVHKSIDEFDLADIDVLITNAFQKMAPQVALQFVREGNSFTITCSFPVFLSESLIATALDNIDSLIERGVKKLTIGYSTVCDHEKFHAFQHDETATSKNDIKTYHEMKQQLYASVYSSQGTMEQLLISRTIQLLNSEEELASVQQLKEKNEKLEAEVKVLSGMKWEVSQSRTREMENIKEIEMLREKISKSENENKKLEAEMKLLKSEVSQLRTEESLSQKTLKTPPSTAPHYPQPLPTASVLLIGSIGMGKSAFGNFLFDPDGKHMFENQTFAIATGNRPMTQEVKVVHKKVKIDHEISKELTIIDTPGWLNESATKDLSHMINILKKLNECQEIRACILVVKFNAKIDAQYRATIEYYSKLLRGLFDKNLIVVMTDYATDERSELMRKRQRIDVEQVKSKIILELGKCFNNQMSYSPKVFMIDCLALHDDEIETSLTVRRAILDYIFQLPPIKVKNQMVAKTNYIKQKDNEKYQKLQGEIAGYSVRLKEVKTDKLKAIDNKKIKIIETEGKIIDLEAILREKDTTEDVIADHWSISEEWKTAWMTRDFSIKSPHKISKYTTWTNGKCEFKNVVQTSHEVSGRVEGNFMRGLYASVTVYTQKRIKYADEINKLKQRIATEKATLTQCKADCEKLDQEYLADIKLLETYIDTRRDEANKFFSDFMTMEEAMAKLDELQKDDRY